MKTGSAFFFWIYFSIYLLILDSFSQIVDVSLEFYCEGFFILGIRYLMYLSFVRVIREFLIPSCSEKKLSSFFFIQLQLKIRVSFTLLLFSLFEYFIPYAYFLLLFFFSPFGSFHKATKLFSTLHSYNLIVIFCFEIFIIFLRSSVTLKKYIYFY